MIRTNKIRLQSGFSLVELIVAVAIGGILMSIAVPSYLNLSRDNCLTTSTNNLVTSLQQARSEAIKRRSRVTLTATKKTTGNTNTAWENGWKVTINEDRNGNKTLDSGEDYDGDKTLDTAALIRAGTITCKATITSKAASLFFNGEGFINTGATFNVCDDRTKETGRQIIINGTGRISTNTKFKKCT